MREVSAGPPRGLAGGIEAHDPLAGLPIRPGHFLLESGLHTDLWITLDALFLEPRGIAGAVQRLAGRLRVFEPTAVCGPFVGGAFLAQAVAAELGIRFYYAELTHRPSGAGLFEARYTLPAGLRASAAGERFAVVDEAISAGSSVRATCASIAAAGGATVVVGTLVVLGDVARAHFAANGIPLVALQERPLNLWRPDACPHCQAGVPLEAFPDS